MALWKQKVIKEMGEGGVKKLGKSGDILYGQHLRCFQVLVDGKQRLPKF